MSKTNYYEDFDLLEDFNTLEPVPVIRNAPDLMSRTRRRAKPRKKVVESLGPIESMGLMENNEPIESNEEDRNTFEFTYHASRHEQGWLVDSLGGFYAQHWIDDVLRLIKGGKEASVYQCLANPTGVKAGQKYIAAKVYRPRQFRNLKNDHLYREGRPNLDIDGNVILDHGMQNAMNKRSDYGLKLLHTSWIEHEFTTMQVLHAASADIPIPYASGSDGTISDDASSSNVILMEYIGDETSAAPTMNTVSLSSGEARPLFQRVLHNIELMLVHNRVHADLSAYNILYWEGEIKLIDFPQAISPHENRNAYPIFERDVTRICEYFARQGVRSNPQKIAANLWTAFKYPLIPDVHPRLLDAEDEKDREYWRRLGNGD